jgi:hypothetical protein
MDAFAHARPAAMHDTRTEGQWGGHPGPGRPPGPLGAECAGGAGWRLHRHPGPLRDRPREWDATEVSALQAYAGVVASLLGAAVRAELKGALAEQLQVALDSLGVDRAGQGALMERERLDEQEAFTHLRRAARSSGRKLTM